MRIQITARGVEVTDQLREFLVRRIHFGLGRFSTRIKAVSVRLADANGPRGGVDKCCDVRVDQGVGPQIHISERQAGIHAAITLAIQRAERSVQRHMELVRPSESRSPSSHLDDFPPEAA